MSVSHTQQSGKQHTELTRRGNEHLATIKTESATTNTKLNGGLPSALTGGGHLKICLQELGNLGSERLPISLGNETLDQLPTALTGEGNLKVSIQEDHTHNLATSAHQTTTHSKLDTIATNTANIKISTDSVNLNVDTLETLQTATNTKLTEIDAVLDTIKTDSAAIKTAVELLDNAVSGNELQVDIVSSALASGGATSANQTTLIGHVDEVESKLDTLETTLTAIETDQAALEVLHTATNSKLDTIDSVLDTIKADSAAIKTAVELIDNAVSGSELQVDVVSAPTTTVTGTVTANLSATDNAVLDDIAQKLGDVETAVQLLDNAVSGNELQVDVVASLPAGDNNIGNVDIASALPAGTNAIGKLSANSGVDIGDVDVTSIAAGTNRIGHVVARANEAADGSGTERHLLCDSAGHLQVDVISAPSTAVTGTVTANLSATDNAVLDDIAQKIGDVETSVQLIDDIVKAEDAAHSSGDKGVMLLGVRQDSQADFGADGDYVPFSIDGDGKLRVAAAAASGGATEAKQDVIESTLTALETSLQALDNAVDGNYLNVNLNIAGTDVDGNSGNKSATSQRVCIATDDVPIALVNTKLDHLSDNLDTLEASLTSMEGKIDTLDAVQDNALTKLGEIDAVLDNIKVDTEAIETAVEALNARDVLVTTLVVDGESVTSGGGTHTTGSFEITKRPKGDGKLFFLIRISGVAKTDVSIAFLASADDTNFFKIPLSFQQTENTTTGTGRIATLFFIPKHLKVELTNGNFSSAATCSVHMFN